MDQDGLGRIAAQAAKVAALADTVFGWIGALRMVGRTRRLRVARYANAVAATLERAAVATGELLIQPRSRSAARRATSEVGRISGHIDMIVAVLDGHLDGRKLVGVKKRLEYLEADLQDRAPSAASLQRCQDNLIRSAGYFRALGEALRV